MKRLFVLFIITGIIFMTLTGISSAGDVKFEVSLDRERLALGETAQLGLSFRGTQSMPAPDIGNIDGLEVRYVGPSTMMTVINGQVSSSVTHMYLVQPLRVGKFQIGPFAFRYKNNNYASNMIILTVTEERPLTQRPQQRPAEEPVEKMDVSDRIFVTLNLEKPTAYVNELIPVTVKLYVNQMNVSDIQLPAFSQEGFSKVEFKEPKQYRERMGGLTYDVLEFRTNLYATRPGDYKVGPAKIKCNIVVRKRRGTSAQDDMFGGDPALRDSFFDDFLARYEKQPIELKSDEVHLIVSPLPAEGMPKDFSGAVGDYQFIFNANPAQVKTGDPVTVRMAINGTGNFNTVLSPKFENMEGFKAYEPEVKTQENSKTFTQVLIPETEKVTQVPRAAFSYFDPIAKAYKTIVQGPISLTVEKAKEELPSKVVGPAPVAARQEEKELASDIIFIKEKPGRWMPRENDLYKKWVFWMAVFIPFILLAAIYIVVGRMNKMKYDAAYASRIAAFKVTRSGMKALKHKLRGSDSRVFYEALFTTMQDYLGNRLHLPPAGLTFDIAAQRLSSENVEMAVITKIRNLFTVCDEARFGFSTFNSEQMSDDYKELEGIMKYLERKRL
ncbi:MAG: BatD family protein [Candidatus Omnitrophica bacterium]|nr:BatD family protein [Candidatus Omnitrophota bacterium]MDD5436069.1 BatD family protein [Candidatus Omnitrophota bacterium]